MFVFGILFVGLAASVVSVVYVVYKLHKSRESPEQEFTLAALPLIVAAALFLGVVLSGLVRAALRVSG